MPDREKVIKGLELCEIGSGDRCYETECPYYGQGCTESLKNDVIALLKEQKAELSYRKAKAITHTATKLDDATCPSCGNVVGEKIRTGAIGQSVVQVRWDYCRFCGQKIDWEGR